MPPGNGVSISIGANAGQANKSLSTVSQSLGKLSSTAKSLFGGANSNGVNQYNRHLQNLERNLERINQRMKTLQGTQAALIQQQKQLQQTGGSLGQHQTVSRAIQQNQRSLSFWQAKQLGAQTAVGVAQQSRPVGGGGGGISGFLANQFQNIAGGVGGALLKALGVAELAKGGAAVASKVFMTAVDEQKALADILPRQRMGQNLAGASPKGFMNELRDRSIGMGYSGLEALKIATAIGPASGGGKNLQNDSLASMQMARMFGIDAGGQASMLAEGGKMGAFVPGQAKRFAEMLAREIGTTGLGPRAQEVQEATLMLMHRQLSTSAVSNAGAAMAAQTVLAKTGLAGFQGAQGAGVLSNFQSAVTGATDDASIGFLEATARDQMGITGYYNMRRLRDQGPLGNAKLFAGYFQEARKLGANADQSKDIMSRVGGMSFTQAEQLYNSTHGFKDINQKNVMGLVNHIKNGGGLVDAGSKSAMTMPGNQVRQTEATVAAVMARLGTPLVQMSASLGQKAAEMIQNLMTMADGTKSINGHMSTMDMNIARITNKIAPAGGGLPNGNDAKAAAAFKAKYGIAPGDAHYDLNRHPVDKSGKPILPGGGPPTIPNIALPHRYGGKAPPVLPPVGTDPHAAIKGVRTLHIKVSFDHTGNIHPHAKQQYMAHVAEAMQEIEQRDTRLNLHTRYPRA